MMVTYLMGSYFCRYVDALNLSIVDLIISSITAFSSLINFFVIYCLRNMYDPPADSEAL